MSKCEAPACYFFDGDECVRNGLPCYRNSQMWYLAGPYRGRTGSPQEIRDNVAKAEQTAARLIEAGYNVLPPHPIGYRLDRWMNPTPPDEFWLAYTMLLMELCDGVFVMDGYSIGTDLECVRAAELGKPVIRVGEVLK